MIDGAPPLAYAISPWPYDPATAAITLRSGHDPRATVQRGFVETWIHEAAEQGFKRLRTNAIGPLLANDIATHGFHIKQKLALLSLEGPAIERLIRDLPVQPGKKEWRMRHVTQNQAISIDRAAFGDEWALDQWTLNYSRGATQVCRLRGMSATALRKRFVAPEGIYLAGHTQQNGYIQRLSVHPRSQRRGVGRALVVDALRWLTVAQVEQVYVNTEITNVAALQLYESLGFSQMHHTLSVMEIEITRGGIS